MKKGRKLNFILLGRSGSGKGTQAKLLMKHFGNLHYVSTGDKFRNLAKQNTDVGNRVEKILGGGGLPHDELATMLWMHYISFNVKENEGLACDGFPRRANEAKDLDEFLKFLERDKNVYVLLIDISREEAFNRLTKRRICKDCSRLIPWVGKFKEMKKCKCGGELVCRHDDSPKEINKRLDWFETRVMAAVNYYKKQKRLIKINGEQSIENVFKDILKAVE